MMLDAVGKGEVRSSILRGSTIKPLILLVYSIHRVVSGLASWTAIAANGQERDGNRWGGLGKVPRLFYVKHSCP